MQVKAIEKLQSEMTANATNSYIQVVGVFLIEHLAGNPQDAEKILVADKTVGKSLEVMRVAAEKKQVKRSAMFTPQEGFDIVMKYFEIDTKPSISVTKPAENVTEKEKSVTKSNDFEINLEDFL